MLDKHTHLVIQSHQILGGQGEVFTINLVLILLIFKFLKRAFLKVLVNIIIFVFLILICKCFYLYNKFNLVCSLIFLLLEFLNISTNRDCICFISCSIKICASPNTNIVSFLILISHCFLIVLHCNLC